MDRFAVQAIRGREEAEARRIGQEYDLSCQNSQRQFDETMAAKAQILGRELRLRSTIPAFRDRDQEVEEFTRYRRGVGGVGGGLLFGAIGSTERRERTWVHWAFLRYHADEQVRRYFAVEADDHPKYFLFQFPRSSRVIHGPNPGIELPPVAMDDRLRQETLDPRYENVTIGEVPFRRVVLRSPLFSIGGPFRGLPFDPTLGFQALIGPTVLQFPHLVNLAERGFDPLSVVYVQVAQPREDLDSMLSGHAQKRDEALAGLSNETRTATTRLRTTLALIGGVTFVALVLGGWLIVGRGLAPVRKLSDAVSRVSERDFKLPVPSNELSVELLPIHDRLTHTLDALRRAFEREKQAVADISHELRTPVAALLTTLDVALRKPRTAEQYKATMEECRAIGKQLSKLVERVMTLASLDSGLDRVHLGPVDLAELAAGCGTVIRPLAGEQEVNLSLDLDPAAEVVTDPDKVREVVMNLLHNAVEYNRPGGDVALSVRHTGAGGAVIEVRDTGIGMTPEVAGRIFERFYRADPSRHATGVHAGLGLAIVREYLDRLGGKVTVDSEPGVGSTFKVILPPVAPGAEGEPGPAV